MSVKKSAVATAAALAATLAFAGGMVEAQLDTTQGISAMHIVETSTSGSAVLFFTVGTGGAAVTKVVTDAKGDVRIYGDSVSAMSAVKRAGVGSSVSVTVRKFDAPVNVGSPVASLIAAHKGAVKEAATGTANKAEITTKKTAAEAQGWNTQVGTPFRAEYDDIVQSLGIVETWRAASAARVTALATALTNAGISPVTYLPLP